MSHWFEEGEYTCRVVRQGFTESRQKGTPGFFLEVEFIAAKGPNNLPQNPGTREITWWVTQNTVEFTIDKLRKLGWTGSKLAELEPGSANHHSLVGQELQVYCQHDGEYDKFDLAREFGSEEVAGLAGKLDKLFGRQVMATATKKSSAKSTAPKKKSDADTEAEAVNAAEVQAIGPDEIPF